MLTVSHTAIELVSVTYFVVQMPQTLFYWCTHCYIQWGHLQLPLVTAFLSASTRLDASGYLLTPISLVFRYCTLHKMSLNMHTNSSTRPLGCLFPLCFLLTCKFISPIYKLRTFFDHSCVSNDPFRCEKPTTTRFCEG